MMPVFGAGSIGLVIGAQLARAGQDVIFVTRSPEAAELIGREGIRIEDPWTRESWTTPAVAVAGAARLPRSVEGPVLFCMRGSQVEAAAQEMAAVAPHATAVCLQNDVHNEAKLARHFPRVIGCVVRQTSTRTAHNAAVAAGAGRLVLGAHPAGLGPDVEALAGRLRAAGYDVGLSDCIGEDKWLKLCVNLMSAPNALIRREDHTTRTFVKIKVRLLEEARAVLAAAGVRARSCDGRDRSLDEEIAHHRASLERGTSARRIPLYNQVWSALRHGGPVEADLYHRRILDLARASGLAAPMNARVLAALERAVEQSAGPESMTARELSGLAINPHARTDGG
jgi:2-dehydropantoate 2-reductase